MALKLTYDIDHAGEPGAGLPAYTDTVVVTLVSGQPGGEPSEFERYMRDCLAEWFDVARVETSQTPAVVAPEFERGRQAEQDRLATELFERGGYATLQLNSNPDGLPRMKFVEPSEARPVDSVRLLDGIMLVREQV